MKGLEGKVGIVTGASRGIGRAIAERLASEGVKLVLGYCSGADEAFGNPINEVVARIEEHGGTVVACDLDLADIEQHQGLVDLAKDTYGHVDILVNNAGIVPFKDFLDVTPEMYDRTHDVNARGTFFLTQKAVKQMILDGTPGRIIFVSSVTSSMTGGRELSHYAGTKADELAYTKSLAFLAKEYGIRVNAVLPGTLETDVNKDDLKQPSSIPGMTKGEEMDMRIPLGLGKPEDLAGPVAFLASDDSSYMTGSFMVVDGGWTAILQ